MLVVLQTMAYGRDGMRIYDLYWKSMPKWAKNNGPFDFGYNYAYFFVHPHIFIRDCCLMVKWFIQRGQRGYSDRDIWNLESYLSGWLPSALKVLETSRYGYPQGMTRRGWETRLRIMREGFEAAKRMEDIPSRKETRYLLGRMNKGLRMFSKHFLSLWD
jgi:hypothetical protein